LLLKILILLPSGTRDHFAEASEGKGLDYVSFFVGLEWMKTIFTVQAIGSETVAALTHDLRKHDCSPENTTDVSIDMSSEFINGVEDNFKSSKITFDRIRALKIINKAIYEVRKTESREQGYSP
jgi:transposase